MSDPKKLFDVITAHQQRKQPGAAPDTLTEETTPPPTPASAQLTQTARQEEKRIGRPAGGKRSNPEYTQVTVFLNKERYLQAQSKLILAGKTRDMSDLLDELLASWLEQHS